MRTVAALYIDPRGPYPIMPGVDCWDEARDSAQQRRRTPPEFAAWLVALARSVQ
jgi:hypothetical protein